MSTYPEFDQGRVPSPEFAAYQQGLYTPPPPPPRRRWGRVIVSLVVVAVVSVGAIAVVMNRQHLVDQWTVWQYAPTPVVEGYIHRATMTDHAAFLFEASQPVVAAAEEFNKVCSNTEEGSSVLGCYQPTDKVITLFDITDDRLDGMEEVVAAHEMLHAAWDRMADDEHRRLTALLEAEVPRLEGNTDFAEKMAIYARTEPGERINELHSIIGTEVAELAPALEEYYSQYFSDRAALVALHVKSNAVFVELAAKSAQLVAELGALNDQMEADYARYQSGYAQLRADIDAYENSNFTSQEESDREYDALISRQSELDALFASIQAMQATYDAKHDELEQLNAQAAALNTSINVVPQTPEPTN